MFTLSHEPHKAKYQGQEMMEFVANAKFEDLPEEVVLRAKHIVVDAIACMLAGYKTRQMFDTSWEFLDNETGDVTVVGSNRKTSAAMAAMLNATHAQTHDYNDGLNNSGMLGGAYHPGRMVVSVALAVGQQVHASGKDVLLAVVLGIEAAARMRNPAHKSYIADAYSGAVVAAKLMGANADQIRAACALCAFMTPGAVGGASVYKRQIHGQKSPAQTTNVLPYSMVARASVESAKMAMMGYDGPVLADNNAISSRYHTCGLGQQFMCMDMYFKPWPTCRKTHGAIAATLELRNQYGVKPEDVKAIRIFQQVTGMYVNVPLSESTDINFSGQFSLQYTVSCAMLDGTVELRHYRQSDRKVPQKYLDFSKKITVIADNGLDGHNAISPNHGIVEVELNDGKVLSMYCKYPLGSEPNAMTHEMRIEKLRLCAEDMTEQEKDELVDWIMNLDTLEAM